MMTVRPDEAAVLVVEDNFQNDVLMARRLAYLDVTQCVAGRASTGSSASRSSQIPFPCRSAAG